MKTHKIFLFIIIFFLFISTYTINADEDYDSLFDDIESVETTDKSTNVFLTPVFQLSLLGEHGFEFHIPVIKDHIDFTGNIKAPRFSNDLGVKLTYKTLKLVTHWQIDAKLNEFGSIEDVMQVRPLENSITWSPWKFKMGAGFLYYTWGTADKSNPTDNLNPWDYSKGLNAQKLSVLSAFVNFYPVDFMSLELVYIPYEQSDIFPVDIANEIEEQFVVNPDIKELDFDPTSFVIGGKINFFFRYVDFSFSYIYDIDPFYTPEIELKNLIVFYNIKSIDLVKKRIHRFGTDIRTTIDRFGIWAEVCYSMTEDYLMSSYKLRNHKLAWAIGFDFNYGPNDDFYFNLEYIGEFRPDYYTNFYKDYDDGLPEMNKDEDYYDEYYSKSLVDYLGGETEGLLHGLSLRMEWPVLNSLLNPKITAVYLVPLLYDYDHEIRYGGFTIRPEFDIMPIDSFHIVIGADLFFSWYRPSGEEIHINYYDTFGVFHNDTNIFIEVKYKWGFDFRR